MRFLTIFIALASTAPIWAGDIQWRSDLEVARNEARQTGKLLMMHFYSDQCVWCDRLESGAFCDESVRQTISDRYVPIKIHGPSNPAWVQAFRIQNYPSDVLLTAEGDVVSRLVSPQDPVQFVAMLERPGRPVVIAGESHHALGGSSTAINLLPPTGSSSTELENSMAVGYSPPESRSDDPLASAFARASHFYGVSAHGLNPPANSVTEGPEARQTYEVARGADGQGGISGDEEGLSPDHLNRPDDLRAGQNLGGLQHDLSPVLSKGPMYEGYCPVAMIEREAWVVGKREFGVVHLGEHYYLADLQAQEKFLQNPERYAPMLNGIDIVRFIDERKVVLGSRAFGWTDPDYGRVFLFSSEETATRFNENFEYYSKQALSIMDRAMAEYRK